MLYSPQSEGVSRENSVSSFLYGVFIYFTIDFFIHFSARIPAYGAMRPSLLLTLVLTLLLFGQREKFKGCGSTPEFRAIIRLIVYIVVSLPFVTWPGSVLTENIPDFIKAVSFFFFAALILDTDKRLRIFMIVFIACQVFRVLEPVYLHLTLGYWGSYTYIGAGEFAGRLSGAPADIINPNELGFVIATLVPFIYYLLWCGHSKTGKLLFLLLMPVLVYALVLTLSRGALVALCVIGWMIFRQSEHKFGLIVITGIIVVVTWSQMTQVQKDRYLSLVESDTGQSATVHGRITGMEEEFMLGLHRPIFGHGLGTTPEAKANIIGKARAAHNLYTELMIEIGLIGLFIFLKYMHTIYQAIKSNDEIMNSAGKEHHGQFPYRLNQALVAVFWMYVIYSMAYWGLSVYYWYLFGGLTFAFTRTYFSEGTGEAPAIMQPGGGATA